MHRNVECSHFNSDCSLREMSPIIKKCPSLCYIYIFPLLPILKDLDLKWLKPVKVQHYINLSYCMMHLLRNYLYIQFQLSAL